MGIISPVEHEWIILELLWKGINVDWVDLAERERKWPALMKKVVKERFMFYKKQGIY